jgi:hypothetical protein
MWFAKGIAPKPSPAHGKYRHYACGEDVEMRPIQPNYAKFYAVAFAYSMMHVAALTLISVPLGQAALMGALYLGLVFVAVIALVTELKLV